MAPTLTVNPEIVFQSLDLQPHIAPQGVITLGPLLVLRIENRQEESAPMRKTIIATESVTLLDDQNRDMWTGPTVPVGTYATIMMRWTDPVRYQRALVMTTVGLKLGYETNCHQLVIHPQFAPSQSLQITVSSSMAAQTGNWTDFCGKRQVVKGMKKAPAGFQQNSQWAIGVILQLQRRLEIEILNIYPIRQSRTSVLLQTSPKMRLSTSFSLFYDNF